MNLGLIDLNLTADAFILKAPDFRIIPVAIYMVFGD